MAIRQLDPAEIGIDAADMKATANTEYELGEPLDVRQDFAWVLSVVCVNVGGGANGDAKLTIDLLAKDKTTVIHQVDLLTAIPTNSAGTTRNVVKWGIGVTPTLDGAATLDSDGADVLAIASFINVRLTVTTQNNGTSSVVSAYLNSERD